MHNGEEVKLTQEDIVALIRIIDVVSTRGAIHAPEMQLVGALYDKLQKLKDSK